MKTLQNRKRKTFAHLRARRIAGVTSAHPLQQWAAVEVKLGGAEAIEEAAKNFARLKNRLPPAKLSTLASLTVLTARQERQAGKLHKKGRRTA